MMCGRGLCFVALTIGVVGAMANFTQNMDSDIWPPQFLGQWSVGKSENFDEYLKAKGYSWFTRQLIKAASITKVFEKAAEPKRYNVMVHTSTKSISWLNIPFNKEFEGSFVDDTQHRIKFYYNPEDGALYEDHVPLDPDSESKPELYHYKPESDKLLLMYMTTNGVTAKRWYHKDD